MNASSRRQGVWPYVAVWDLHPTGEPALAAAAFAVFGASLETLRLLAAVAGSIREGAVAIEVHRRRP